MFNKDGSIDFHVTDEQRKKFEKWKKTLPKIADNKFGAVGGNDSFVFTITGIGVIVEGVRNDKPKKHRINLTDFSTW